LARLGVVAYDGRDEETLTESIGLIKLLEQAGLEFVRNPMAVIRECGTCHALI
jgi:hypothetical protein